MEHRKYVKPLRLTAALGAVALTALRFRVLRTAFDQDGLLPPGSAALPLTALACAVVFAALCVPALRLNRLPGSERCFARRRSWLVPRLAAAELLLLGALLALLDGSLEMTLSETLITLAGAVSALLFVWTALQPERGPQFFWVRFFCAACAAAMLIVRFRIWSHEPLVIHIVPSMLAWVFCMTAMMLLTGFPLGAGHRRSTVLFGLSAAVFVCMTLPDCIVTKRIGLPEMLTLSGFAVWSACAALELLRDRVQDEQPKAETPAAETPAEETQPAQPAQDA